MRLDLFGDTLESIRAFDPETQRSTKQLKESRSCRSARRCWTRTAISRFRTGYLETFGAPATTRSTHVIDGAAGGDGALPAALLRGAGDPLRLPAGRPITLDHLAASARDERLDLVEDAYEARVGRRRDGGSATLQPEPADPALPRRAPSGTSSWAADAARFSAFNEAEGEAVIDMGAGRAQLLGRARCGQRQPVRGHGRLTPTSSRARQAGAVRLVVGGLAPTAWATCWPTTALKAIRFAPLRGDRRPAADPRSRGGAAARSRLRDRPPRGHLRDRHPGRPPGAARRKARAPTSWPRRRR